MDGAILLEDKLGEKYSSLMGGLIKRTSTVNVLRGELLVPIPGDKITPRKDGEKPHNYRVKSDAKITLYCTPLDVAPLDDYDLLLYEAVSSPSVRYSMFLSGHKTCTDGAQRLKSNSDVYYAAPRPGSVPTQAKPQAAADVGGLGLGDDMKGGVFFGANYMVSF